MYPVYTKVARNTTGFIYFYSGRATKIRYSTKYPIEVAMEAFGQK